MRVSPARPAAPGGSSIVETGLCMSRGSSEGLSDMGPSPPGFDFHTNGHSIARPGGMPRCGDTRYATGIMPPVYHAVGHPADWLWRTPGAPARRLGGPTKN